MAGSSELAPREAGVLEEILERTLSDLSMVGDRELELGPVSHERLEHRPAGAGRVHIAYRLRLQHGPDDAQGCLLVPLPDAMALAGCLLMLAPTRVSELRHLEAPDRTTKEAIQEVGTYLASAAESALRGMGMEEARVQFAGCQGVRADVRPRLEYREGSTLLVARAEVEVEPGDPLSWTLMLPALSGLAED